MGTRDQDVTVHLFNITDPDGEETFPIHMNTNTIPRLGEHVHYWVDYPEHMPDGEKFEENEPAKIDGVVAKVEIEYRRMRYGRENDITMVSVYLKNYVATPPKQTA